MKILLFTALLMIGMNVYACGSDKAETSSTETSSSSEDTSKKKVATAN